MRTFLYKSYLTSYRVMAALVLYGMLTALGSYGFIMGFYVINTSWVAPVLISPSNDKILTMTAQLVASQQAMDSFIMQNKNLVLNRTEQTQRRSTLQALDVKVSEVLKRTKQVDLTTGAQLTALADQKAADIERTQKTI